MNRQNTESCIGSCPISNYSRSFDLIPTNFLPFILTPITSRLFFLPHQSPRKNTNVN